MPAHCSVKTNTIPRLIGDTTCPRAICVHHSLVIFILRKIAVPHKPYRTKQQHLGPTPLLRPSTTYQTHTHKLTQKTERRRKADSRSMLRTRCVHCVRVRLCVCIWWAHSFFRCRQINLHSVRITNVLNVYVCVVVGALCTRRVCVTVRETP